jgi:hypothetical protein
MMTQMSSTFRVLGIIGRKSSIGPSCNIIIMYKARELSKYKCQPDSGDGDERYWKKYI